jgi:hypothetical protein
MQQRKGWTQTVRAWWSGETATIGSPLVEERAQEGGKQYRMRPLYKGAAAFVIAALLFGPRAHGQFGIDTAAILAALHQMQSLMQNYIAAPLKTINQAQQSIAKYEQQVMYPMQQIQQARNSVTQYENQFKQLKNIFGLNLSSATLPQSQALESVLLSRNPANVPGVSTQFQNVYGVVMPQNTASPDMRNMTDTTDAQAQDAMKRAVQIDALADTELAEADKMGQQITVAAPGSAPILEAEADAWLVRANAYTQSALAELMRTRAIDIANQSKLKKFATNQNQNNNSLINSSLSR